MGKSKLDETYKFEISIKMQFFWCSYCYKISVFLEFGLLLSRVAPYYSSLPRTVWLFLYVLVSLCRLSFTRCPAMDILKVIVLGKFSLGSNYLEDFLVESGDFSMEAVPDTLALFKKWS